MPIGKIQLSGQLLLVAAKGKLTTSEVIKIVTDFYPSGSAQDIIWDFTDGSLELIRMQGIREIAGATLTALKSGAREGGKKAYVSQA